MWYLLFLYIHICFPSVPMALLTAAEWVLFSRILWNSSIILMHWHDRFHFLLLRLQFILWQRTHTSTQWQHKCATCTYLLAHKTVHACCSLPAVLHAPTKTASCCTCKLLLLLLLLLFLMNFRNLSFHQVYWIKWQIATAAKLVDERAERSLLLGVCRPSERNACFFACSRATNGAAYKMLTIYVQGMHTHAFLYVFMYVRVCAVCCRSSHEISQLIASKIFQTRNYDMS